MSTMGQGEYCLCRSCSQGFHSLDLGRSPHGTLPETAEGAWRAARHSSHQPAPGVPGRPQETFPSC